MRAMPLSIGTIHFVGIGGIGMSALRAATNSGFSRRTAEETTTTVAAPRFSGR